MQVCLFPQLHQMQIMSAEYHYGATFMCKYVKMAQRQKQTQEKKKKKVG